MTIIKLLVHIGIVALVLTLFIGILKKGHKHWVMTFLQNFTGVLFVFSGWVKAVDPMGTAFKMEQYFAEFESTFEGTWATFIAPLFPWLAQHAIWFSVFMIVLEIVVGVLLIMGHRAKMTSWIFLLVLVFFTILTGFTFLTGYVPPGENFFTFSQWGAYHVSNMRVTDCGCFGDFIKLEPRTSFLKDIVLLIPALIFVFRHKDMHVLFTSRIRSGIAGIVTIGLLIYCMYNFVWNEPHIDFRPFKVGVNVAEQKAAEEDAAGAVQILTWKLQNKVDGKIIELSNDVYMKEFESYPREEWTFLDNTKTEPRIPATKISDFKIMDLDGNELTADILENPDPILLVLCYKLYGEVSYAQEVVQDSIFQIDTVRVGDTTYVVRSLASIVQKEVTKPVYTWDEHYISHFLNKVNPLVIAADEASIHTYAVAGGVSEETIRTFLAEVNATYPMYEADDIMLKTIMRSNPGLVLMKNGVILGKWHHRHFPDVERLKQLSSQ